MRNLLILASLCLLIACSTKSKGIAVAPIGIQDVFLGDSINKFKDRLGYQDSMMIPKKTMMHWINLKDPMLESCQGNNDAVRAISYRGRIIELETRLGCDGINELFIKKFGKPKVNARSILSWEFEDATLLIEMTGEKYLDSSEEEIITFTSISLYEDYKKNETKGNI